MTKKKNKVEESMAWVCPNGHRAGRTNEKTKICPICKEKMHREYKVTVTDTLGAKGQIKENPKLSQLLTLLLYDIRERQTENPNPKKEEIADKNFLMVIVRLFILFNTESSTINKNPQEYR